MNLTKSVLKITLENEQSVFLFSEYEPRGKLSVQILNFQQSLAYCGQVGDIDLRAQAACICMTFSEFVSQISNAFFRSNPGSVQYLYSLEKDGDKFNFKWKSKDSDETVRNLGYIGVEQKDFATVSANVLNTVGKVLSELNDKIADLQSTLEESEKQKVVALDSLSKAVNTKESLEKELYTKFVLVLNEKKKKIRELKTKSCTSLKTISNKTIKNTKVRGKAHQLSDSSEELNESLEDINKTGPSTSSHNNLLSFSDDHEMVIPVTPSKIRKRNVGNNQPIKHLEPEIKLIKQDPKEEEAECDDLLDLM